MDKTYIIFYDRFDSDKPGVSKQRTKAMVQKLADAGHVPDMILQDCSSSLWSETSFTLAMELQKTFCEVAGKKYIPVWSTLQKECDTVVVAAGTTPEFYLQGKKLNRKNCVEEPRGNLSPPTGNETWVVTMPDWWKNPALARILRPQG